MMYCVFAGRRVNAERLHFFRLIIAWILGFLFGVFFAYFDVPLFTSMMCLALFEPVSIVGTFICVFTPLFCSVFFMAIGRSACVALICFLKAVAFGFSASLLYLVFHSAGWLVIILFLFSDCFFTAFLFLFWLRCAGGRTVSDLRLCRFVIAGLLISGLDIVAVQPFLRRVL